MYYYVWKRNKYNTYLNFDDSDTEPAALPLHDTTEHIYFRSYDYIPSHYASDQKNIFFIQCMSQLHIQTRAHQNLPE